MHMFSEPSKLHMWAVRQSYAWAIVAESIYKSGDTFL